MILVIPIAIGMIYMTMMVRDRDLEVQNWHLKVLLVANGTALLLSSSNAVLSGSIDNFLV